MVKENLDLMAGDIFYKENKGYTLNLVFKKRKKIYMIASRN